ncbi:Polysaccharide pyruvyl transferase [Agrococcus baldri]|uniref:Polysaccharide pyruvyl transferase n=1 Tax=Agrococcus baldri TaxID=153730 RepID=A0AA94HKJ5_9MICO|nr:polysaccharide pyruvyl transferase family protein [Agrococcus baldri]SFS00253.1 Polysaccharide pyruvyl transferase [Agrococcus baldri]
MKYAITGPYCDVNFGDYAMLPNNLASFPASPSVIFSFNDEFLASMLEDYALAQSAEVVHVGVTQEVEDLPTDRSLAALEILRCVENLDALHRWISSVDALIVNGGGYINDLWARPHRLGRLVAILAPALVAAQQGKQVHFTANGFGPFSESFDFFASVLSRMPTATFTCRDDLGSAGWLRRLGIADDRIYLAPDDLLVLHPSIEKRTPRWRPPDPAGYLVLETYRPMEELEDNVGSLRALQADLDTSIVLLPMHRGHGGEDQAHALSGILPRAHVYPISDSGYLPIEDAVNIIRGARLTVTDRYHGLVAALGAASPVVSIIRPVRGSLDYYYRKNAGALAWRLAPGAYSEDDFIRLQWSEVPTTAKELEALVARQTEAYSASHAHFENTGAARGSLVRRIFSS